MSLSEREVVVSLAYLLTQDFKAISKIVARKLEIDTRSRVEAGNRLNLTGNGRSLRETRIINKALAMELLVAASFTYIDRPAQVISGCVVRNGLPNNFASSGAADLVVSYPPCDGRDGFYVLVEVSIKRRVSAEDYRQQLEQTLRHATELAAQYKDTPVFGLLINSGNICAEGALHAVYKRFSIDNHLTPDKPIKVVAVPCGNFLNILGELVASQTYDFKSSLLVEIFDTLIATLQEQKLPADEDWMEQTWLHVVRHAQNPELNLTQDTASDQ